MRLRQFRTVKNVLLLFKCFHDLMTNVLFLAAIHVEVIEAALQGPYSRTSYDISFGFGLVEMVI